MARAVLPKDQQRPLAPQTAASEVFDAALALAKASLLELLCEFSDGGFRSGEMRRCRRTWSAFEFGLMSRRGICALFSPANGYGYLRALWKVGVGKTKNTLQVGERLLVP